MSFSFGSFNRDFLFELPESIEGVYLKMTEAEEKYGGDIIPVIGYGISKNTSETAVSEENGWIATEEEHINVPAHQIPQLREMMNSKDAVAMCKKGKMGAMIVHYSNQYGDQIKLRWIDRK